MERSRIIWSAFFLAVFLCPVFAEDGQQFENATAGISVVRPAGWHTASLQEVEANRERVRIPDEELQEAIRKYATAPLFVFTKHTEPHDNLNPSIQVILRPLGPLAGLSPTKIMEVAMTPLQQTLADFAFVKEIHETSVSGMPAAHMKATYTLTMAEGGEFRALARTWIVPRGSFMFLIGMSGPEQGPHVSEEEFADVIQSVEIKN